MSLERSAIFRVVTWNIGGAKFLELPSESTADSRLTRKDFQYRLHDALRRLTRDFQPDVILLQETVQYGDVKQPSDLIVTGDISGYYYDMSTAIDTENQSHPQKWRKYFSNNNWAPNTYLAQGYGLLWRQELQHAAIWEFASVKGPRLEKEIVRLETGLFTGSRDTEPRLAAVTHFVIDFHGEALDIFVVNLHLTTIRGEREGSPGKDIAASRVRQQQLDLIANGVVSRYNEWAREKHRQTNVPRRQPVWVLGGDFNCMPSAPEIAGLEQMNFVDLNPNKGGGTKGNTVPIKTATITLDYLFAGPAYYSLDPYLAKHATRANPLPLSQYSVSDHFPVLADVPIVPMGER